MIYNQSYYRSHLLVFMHTHIHIICTRRTRRNDVHEEDTYTDRSLYKKYYFLHFILTTGFHADPYDACDFTYSIVPRTKDSRK